MVLRHFLDWNQPALPAAADYLIERYAQGEQLNLSGVILVFPGRRAARRMLELLVQKSADRWPGLYPPQLMTFQQFPEVLYVQQRQLADDLTQLLVWQQALSAIPPQELTAALPGLPDPDSIMACLALCETLRSQHNELAADGMEFDNVFDALIRIGDKDEAARWKALRRIQAEYLMQMDELALWDRQAARLVAVQQQECRTDRDIILIGTVDMNRIVRQMLDQVSDRVTALIHAPAEEAEAFDEYGCLIPEHWQHRRLNIPVAAARIVDSPGDQAQQVIHELAALNGSCRPDDVVIGMADDSLVPVMLQSLSDAGTCGRWPVGRQVRNTRPCRLLSAVAEHLASARDGQPADFATLTDLLRHPDVADFVSAYPELLPASRRRRDDNSDSNWLAAVDRYLAEHLQTTPGTLLGRDPQKRVVGAVCQAVKLLLAQLVPSDIRPTADSEASGSRRSGAAGGRRSRGRQLKLQLDVEERDASLSSILSRKLTLLTWAEGCLRLLSLVYRGRRPDPEQPVDQGISVCVDSLQSTVETLRSVPVAVLPAMTAAQAIQLLLKQIADGDIPSDPDDRAIDLLGWLDLPLDDSPAVILTGFNEGFLPRSVSSDVFLPNTLRTQLGLIDNERRYARDAYALTALMHNHRHFVLIAGRRDVQGNPLAPGRLWFAADPESLPERVRLFYAPELTAGRDRTLPASVQSQSRVSGFIVPPPSCPASVPKEISVTAFRDYLYCPYRYCLRRELHLTAVDDEIRELSAASFGSLMHDVLNRFATSAARHAISVEAIETCLLIELQRLASLRFGQRRSATVSVQLKMLENRLLQFARWQAETTAEGWRIFHTEADLKYSEFRDIRERPVTLSGRVDRIDQHLKTGEWRVLDYKTSEAADKPESTHRKGDQWIDLQLPLYRLLVRALGIDGDLQLGYIHLPGDLSAIGCSIAGWELADLESAEQTAREVAADILDLKIDRVAPGEGQRASEFARVCQETVIERQIPWLAEWPGRRSS